MFASLFFACAMFQANEAFLHPPLEPFRPLFGASWEAEIAMGETSGTDVLQYERALNGYAVRMRHSVNNGEYGGETLFIWDAESELLRGFYFSTAGFRSESTLTWEGNILRTRETVFGFGESSPVYRGTLTLESDDTVRVQIEEEEDGEWVTKGDRHYRRAPGKTPAFR